MGQKDKSANGLRGDGGAKRGTAIQLGIRIRSEISGISKDFSCQWVSATLASASANGELANPRGTQTLALN